jgi:hypothetical protein
LAFCAYGLYTVHAVIGYDVELIVAWVAANPNPEHIVVKRYDIDTVPPIRQGGRAICDITPEVLDGFLMT